MHLRRGCALWHAISVPQVILASVTSRAFVYDRRGDEISLDEIERVGI
jgi:hypothetical protein